MTAQEAYDHYTIMPSLQLHQLRVAAIASIIVDVFERPLDRNEIITACLLHDMGNIIKSDLQKFPQFLEPEGFGYWNQIKTSFLKKYGTDEHKATYEIATEIGISGRSADLLSAIGFTKAHTNSQLDDFGKKICCYADQRVTPHGVSTLRERLDEGPKRYRDKFAPGETALGRESLILMEKQIFTYCKISPDDIREESIQPLLKGLRARELI